MKFLLVSFAFTVSIFFCVSNRWLESICFLITAFVILYSTR